MATAYAALVSLENNLTLIQNHPRHSFSFEHQQIDSLLKSVCFLINYMKDIDDSHRHTKEAAEVLERRIARAAHAAEDVIESHVVDQIRAGSTLAAKTTPRYLLDLQKAIHDMDYVVTKASKVMATKEIDAEQQPTIPAAVEATTSPTPLASEKDKMVGFDDQLLRLLDLLTGVPRSRRVISIVGMGGIGKTTLATNAFQHSHIVHYFDVCLWATVSPEFSVQKILTQLLSQMKEKTSFLFEMCSSVSSVGEGLYKSLFGRRYLIVLDDMWSVEAWDVMKFFFPDTSNGSRIIVTTRQSVVATHLGSRNFNVRFLDVYSSWDLFCGKTFGDQGCPPELESAGKRIVKNCGGLPLSIVVVGCWLQKSSRKTEYWENVANDMNSILDSGVKEQYLSILSLSYRYLPVHLKPCFLFLGVFPKNPEISMDDLISLWIGEGFIQQNENVRLEFAAKTFVNDLIGRRLVTVKRTFDRSSWKCSVHDLLREMCLKIAKKEEFLSVFNPGEAINRERRVVMKGKIPEEPKIFHAPPRLACIVRSVICEGGELSFDLKLLRVLNKVDSALVNGVYFQQVNLRYLKVDVGYMSYLPSSISLLWNLQTLIINGVNCGSIIAPYEIWEMLHLRRIEIYTLSLVDPLPTQGGLDQENELVLENLRTLSAVENLRLSEEVCRRIPNIQELELLYGYVDEPSSYYCPNNLGCFQKLCTLKCRFNGKANWHGFVLSLNFPTSLTQLHLRGCRVGWEELTMKVGWLPHLRVLKLLKDAVSGSEWSPVEGGFPCLQSLIIKKCDLIHWNADESHFPVLEEVYLIALSELDEFPSAFGEIPTLGKIILEYCSVSSSFSAMRMVVEQEEQGNEGLQLFVGFKCDEENTLEDFKQMAEEEGLTRKNIFIYE